MLLGVAHVLAIWPRYIVGSFDDDANYIMSAKALAAGHGLGAHLASGEVVAGLYPPGYPALLAPLTWLWPHWFTPLRALSVLCYAAVFPLTWLYLGRRRVPDGVRVAVGVLLALNPVLGTYGSMVMAEAPFLVLLLLLLLAVDRWDHSPRVWSGPGVATTVAAAAVVWVKEAGLGLVVGLVLWMLVRRQVGKAVALSGAVVALLAPVAAARLAAGVPLGGARYAQELGSFYSGGLGGRLVHVVPHGIWQFFSTALPASIMPYLQPLPVGGHWPDLWKVLSWHVTILCGIGAAVWLRRHRDAAVAMVVVYVAESTLWPFVNERRSILVLPLLVAWYALGARAVWQWVKRRWAPASARTAVAWLAVGAVLVPLAAQFPRDYLYAWGQSSPHTVGSRYVKLLAALGRPNDVVETDYRSTIALFTGHRTAYTSFLDNLNSCSLSATTTDLAADHAGYFLLGAVNKPGVVDNPCMLSQATSAPWAVRLLRTAQDQASVFELIGPGTAHPDLVELTSVADVTAPTAGGAPGPLSGFTLPPNGWGDSPDPATSTVAAGSTAMLQWTWGAQRPVTQVSVGEAGAVSGPTGPIQLQLQGTSGAWTTVAASSGAVGDGGASPFLLAQLPAGTQARAIRLVIHATGAVMAVDVRALGVQS